MKSCALSRQALLVLLLLLAAGNCWTCLAAARSEIKIPDIPGYQTLKCDFHMHTVFSDGAVWPTVRVEEAWRGGLDAIAITDHVEYTPHRNDVRPDCGRAYELARPAAENRGIILIGGAEITRSMPPGHLNAIFLKNAKALDVNDWRDAIRAAIDQNAFVFWNHPGWPEQAKNGIPVWYPEHTELLEKGWLHGMEVVNDNEYYPLVQKWAAEKKLTMLGNSDVHDPIALAFDREAGEHRPITLVFAKEKTEQAIKEALFAHRTVVYHRNILIGDASFLKPIFDLSVRIMNPQVTLQGQNTVNLMVHNGSQIDFELAAEQSPEEITAPRQATLSSEKTVILGIKAKKAALAGTREIRIPYRVKNLLVEPDRGLYVELPITVTFIASETR